MNIGEDEIAVLVLSFFLAGPFLKNWYYFLFKSWLPDQHDEPERYALGSLPIVSFVIMLYTLKTLASFDVVNSTFFIAFYVVLGYAWLWLGMMLMFCFFDLSWIDDVLNLRNKAALPAIAGGFLGLTVIYAGANIGDGPGWWCVLFAGGMGLAAWFILGDAIYIGADVSERITVERDLGCGIRFGFYLLASGIFLGRASAGDWTSFSMTITEFYDVYDKWPVLLLTALAAIVEKFCPRHTEKGGGKTVFFSVLLGALYVFIAVVSFAVLPSLPINPIYRAAP